VGSVARADLGVVGEFLLRGQGLRRTSNDLVLS